MSSIGRALWPASVLLATVACGPDSSDKDLDADVPDSTTAGTTDDTTDTDDTAPPTDSGDSGGTTEPEPEPTDADGDGYYSPGTDCDDTDPDVHPGAEDDTWHDRDCDLGVDRALIDTRIVPSPDRQYLGFFVEALPDLDGDGAAELFASSERGGGADSIHIWSGATLSEGASLTTDDAIATVTTAAALSDWHMVGGDPMGWGGPSASLAFPPEPTAENDVYLLNLAAIATGTEADLDTAPMVSGTDLPAGSDHGIQVVSDMDFDGDGIDDLIISATGGTGTVYVHLGAGLRTSPRRAATDADLILEGEARHHFGSGLSSFGDVDGDGIEDLAVGEPYARPPSTDSAYAGRAYVFTGGTSLPDGPLGPSDARTTIGGTEDNRNWGKVGDTIGVLGDITGDGVAEVYVAAPEGGSSWAGAVWYIDPTTLPEGTATIDDAHHVVEGSRGMFWVGTWVSGGFDFDEDGVNDTLVTQRDSGAILHLVSGSSLTAGGTTVLGEDPTLGAWRSSPPGADATHAEGDAGDFDGDGRPELVFAGALDPVAGVEQGSIYIVHDRP